MDFASIGKTIMQHGSRALLVAQKHAPEILMVTGTVAVVGSVIMTGRATVKASDILDKHESVRDEIEEAHNLNELPDEEYSEEEYEKDILVNKVQCARELVIDYLPAATLLIFGVGCFFGAHNILSKRYVAVLGAYKLCEEAFSQYRDRVKTELGEEQDIHFYYGTEIESQKLKIKNEETGKTKTVTKDIQKITGCDVTQYSRFFDEANPNWSKSPDDNRFFLARMQNALNDKLVAQGHLFLNEVYDALGFERSKAGAIVGWVYNDDISASDGDGYVDFRIYDPENLAKREFVNGYEPSILIDFNCQGVIYDLI
jgi:hypothetical protein